MRSLDDDRLPSRGRRSDDALDGRLHERRLGLVAADDGGAVAGAQGGRVRGRGGGRRRGGGSDRAEAAPPPPPRLAAAPAPPLSPPPLSPSLSHSTSRSPASYVDARSSIASLELGGSDEASACRTESVDTTDAPPSRAASSPASVVFPLPLVPASSSAIGVRRSTRPQAVSKEDRERAAKGRFSGLESASEAAATSAAKAARGSVEEDSGGAWGASSSPSAAAGEGGDGGCGGVEAVSCAKTALLICFEE